MAGSDYCNCDNCGASKIFYDANVDWTAWGDRIGSIRVICRECFDSGVRLEITNTKIPFDTVS